MSSMRNTNQHRNHRERGQPLEREVRLGNLEKHKVRRLTGPSLRACLLTLLSGLLLEKQKPQ